MVQAFGATAHVEGDTLSITGTAALHGARFDSQGDHRMAMAAAVAALAAGPGERSLVTGFGAVETSYPQFADDLRHLTGTEPSAPRALVIAIDGPAGAGKSTVSKAVAARLGLDRLDTGAMYRAVAAFALALGIPPDDHDAVAALAAEAEIDPGTRVLINGRDVTDVIRSPEVGQAVSVVAANAAVRTQLVRRQRAWAQDHGGGVVEGRDIGSVVFPHAEVKIYLTATAEERARRRRDESPAGVARRDRIDSTRAASPLAEAHDAHRLDTTGRSVQDVVEEVLSWL
jgi:cytidylate kinase